MSIQRKFENILQYWNLLYANIFYVNINHIKCIVDVFIKKKYVDCSYKKIFRYKIFHSFSFFMKKLSE